MPRGGSILDWDICPTSATLRRVMTRPRRALRAGAAILVLLALGVGIAFVLTDALGIRSEPSDIPAETLVAAPEAPVAVPPTFTEVTAPDSLRVAMAVEELQDAVIDAGATEGTATLEVVVEGSGAAAASARPRL